MTISKTKNNKVKIKIYIIKLDAEGLCLRRCFLLTFPKIGSRIMADKRSFFCMERYSTVVFVKLNDGCPFDIKMKYPMLGLKNAVQGCYLRKSVYELLIKAEENLPEGYRLRIWDAWRPLSLQRELYETYRLDLIHTFNLSPLSQEEQESFISKYIAIPSENPDLPPAHTTGGAVDLTLIDKNGNELDMGTCFDDFSEKAATDYFENQEYNGTEVQKNRRILKEAMTRAGFANLPSEWWHYDYGNRNWANFSKNESVYKGVFREQDLIIE